MARRLRAHRRVAGAADEVAALSFAASAGDAEVLPTVAGPRRVRGERAAKCAADPAPLR